VGPERHKDISPIMLLVRAKNGRSGTKERASLKGDWCREGLHTEGSNEFNKGKARRKNFDSIPPKVEVGKGETRPQLPTSERVINLNS